MGIRLNNKQRVNANYTHPKRADENPFLYSKSNDLKKKNLNDVEVCIFFPFSNSYHHNLNFFKKPIKIWALKKSIYISKINLHIFIFILNLFFF